MGHYLSATAQNSPTAIPTKPPPSPPAPSHAPRGKTPRHRDESIPLALRAERLRALYQEPAHYLSATAQKNPTSMTRYVCAHRPLYPCYAAVLPRFGVARGPASPRIGARARCCERGPGSPLELVLICLRAVMAEQSSSVSSSSFIWLFVLFGFLLLPHAYSRGLRTHPLALSATCIARLRCAKTHAAKAALRQIG